MSKRLYEWRNVGLSGGVVVVNVSFVLSLFIFLCIFRFPLNLASWLDKSVENSCGLVVAGVRKFI